MLFYQSDNFFPRANPHTSPIPCLIFFHQSHLWSPCANPGTCGSPTTPKTCPQSCSKKRRPVCGTDGKTYHNGCHLALTKCSLPKNQKRQLRVKHNGSCGGKKQPRRCLSIRKCRHKKGGPVCASDGKTYPSKCHLRVVKCNIKRKRNFGIDSVPNLKHMGKCSVA